MSRIRRYKKEEEKEPANHDDSPKKRRKKFSKYGKVVVGIAAALGIGSSDCSPFKLEPLPSLDAGPDSSVIDAGRDAAVDAAVDADIDAKVDAGDAAVDASEDAGDAGIVCNNIFQETSTVDISLNNTQTVGGFDIRYTVFDNTQNPPLVTVDIECNGGQKAKVGIVLVKDTPHVEVINGVSVTLTYNSVLPSGGSVNITVEVQP